ncbi:MAG: hypothetical protein Q9227_008241 [Pyrenula ochraceoflavens]
MQRSGRAGRTREGMAWRMCTETGFHEQLSEHSVPAILEGDMVSECLDILMMQRSPINFPYIVAPASETIVKALGLLKLLGAVDSQGRITPRGRKIKVLPIDVYNAATLLDSESLLCGEEMLSLVSIMEASDSGSNLFVSASNPLQKKRLKEVRDYFSYPGSEHLALFNVYMAWRAECLKNTQENFLRDNMLQGSVLREADRMRLQLFSILNRAKFNFDQMKATSTFYYTNLLKALAAGNYLRVAKRCPQMLSLGGKPTKQQYQTVRTGVIAELTEDTNLGPPTASNEWVIYNECHISDASKNTIRLVSAISPELLVSAKPTYWHDLEFTPEGHIKNGLLEALSHMSGKDKSFFLGGMPQPTTPTSTR